MANIDINEKRLTISIDDTLMKFDALQVHDIIKIGETEYYVDSIESEIKINQYGSSMIVRLVNKKWYDFQNDRLFIKAGYYSIKELDELIKGKGTGYQVIKIVGIDL